MLKSISAWLKETETRPSKLAKDAGISPQLISRYVSGSRIAGPLNILKLRRATGGAIDLEYWASLEERQLLDRRRHRKTMRPLRRQAQGNRKR